MEMIARVEGSVTVIKLRGRFDSGAAPSVEKKIDEVIEGGCKRVVLDFSDLEYISSAGIRVLVSCSKELEKQSGAICLAVVPKPIENVLYITGFLPYFQIFESLELALHHLD